MHKRAKSRTWMVGGLAVMLWMAAAVSVQAGDLDSPGAPTDAASEMYTLEGVYNRLDTGAAGAPSAFAEPAAGPTAGTGRTLNEVMSKAPAVNASASATTEVLSGKAFWGLSLGGWGLQSGSMPNIGAQNITPGASAQTITQGYHDGTGAVAGDADLAASNIVSGVDIFGVTGSAVEASGAATDAQVLSGVSYSNASGASVGTMANIGAQNITPGASAQTITQGYHDGNGAVAGDADLVSGNIKSGADIFGVAGDTNVVDTSSGDALTTEIISGRTAWVGGVEVTGTRAVAPVAKTGQTTSHAAGDDGDLETGEAWPTPRFTDNGDGTVTDNLTGLVWLKNANFFGTRNWATALTDCATLNSGEAGLTDGSVEGDWRLPNVKELQSLMDYGRYDPALPAGHPFTGVQSSYYWSGTTHAYYTTAAWYVFVSYGSVSSASKALTYYVWPVRSGQ